MSQSLENSFDKMKIAPGVPKKQRMKLDLPTLDTKGRVCFYGFAVTSEWLVDYAKLHWSKADQYDDLTKASTAMDFLRMNSHINSLLFEYALVDSTTPDETIITLGHRDGEPMVLLIAICSNQESSYRKRPSQANVDKLSQMIGREPRWWVDYEDPRSYED